MLGIVVVAGLLLLLLSNNSTTPWPSVANKHVAHGVVALSQSVAGAMALSSAVSFLFGRHLLATNLALSTFLSALGDVLQQRWEMQNGARKMATPSVNFTRTAHMSCSFGFTSGFLCHYWYNLLDRFVPGSGVRIVLRKILFDQVGRAILARKTTTSQRRFRCRSCSAPSSSAPAWPPTA